MNSDIFSSSLVRVLSDCILPSRGRDIFDSRKFEKIWFFKTCTPLYFAFAQTREQTNIVFAELFSLLRAHAGKSGKTAARLLFITTTKYVEYLGRLIEALTERDESEASEVELKSRARSMADALVKYYHTLLENVVVVQPFEGSCLVFIPPGVEVGCAVICAEAGYIHSCGRALNAQPVSETKIADLREAIERHQTACRAECALLIHDNPEKSRTGSAQRPTLELPHLTVDPRKYSLGNVFLADSYLQVSREIGASCELSSCISEKLAHELQTGKKCCLWLVADRAMEDRKHCYIAYDQHFKNDDPLFVFDEDKPAWLEPVTLPPRLAAAMLNLTRPYLEGEISVLDPFGGSGTVPFEATKLPVKRIHYNDWDPLATFVARTNRKLLTRNPAYVERLVRDLKGLARKKDERDMVGPKLTKAIHQAEDLFRLFQTVATQKKEREGKPSRYREVQANLGRLRAESEVVQLLFYCRRRAQHFRKLPMEWCKRELSEELLKELSELICRLEEYRARLNRHAPSVEEGVSRHRGTYSPHCCISVQMRNERLRSIRFSSDDIAHLLERIVGNPPQAKHLYDVIVTDPPYGLNAPREARKLAELYCKSIEYMIRALKPDGQLVLCLPEETQVHAQLPFFTHPLMVKQQVLTIGARLGRRVERLEEELIGLNLDFPYYWKAKSGTLIRRILHYRFGPVGSI